MNKEEFLKKLREKLNILEDQEIEDIISEYETYIDEKVASGKTEEASVAELGDFNEIVRDLLAAYKVKEPKETNGFETFFNKISLGIDKFTDKLSNMSGREVIRMFIEIIIIILLIMVMKIPFDLINDFGYDIFSELGKVGRILGNIWEFIITLAYIILAVVLFIKLIQKRYFQDLHINDTYEEKIKKERVHAQKEKIEVIKPEAPKPKKEKSGFIDTLVDIAIFILKIIVLFMVMGLICYSIGMAIALGVMIYLLCQGITYIGVLILIIGLFWGGIFLLKLGFKFIFNKEINGTKVLSELICLIIIMGIGIGFTAIEISRTEIIYDKNYVSTKTITKDITMQEDLILYNVDSYEVDNTLDNIITIEYVYPDFNNSTDIQIDLQPCGLGYCLNESVNHFNLNKAVIDYVLDNLKDKKIYISDWKIEKIVYASEENISKLKSNKIAEKDAETYTFTKTYNVLNISEVSDHYLYLSLSSSSGEVETVKVLKSLALNIQKGYTYDFTFLADDYDYATEKAISDIFDECTLVSITPAAQEGSNNPL